MTKTRQVEISVNDAFVIKLALEDRARITAGDRLWPAHEAAMLARTRFGEEWEAVGGSRWKRLVGRFAG